MPGSSFPMCTSANPQNIDWIYTMGIYSLYSITTKTRTFLSKTWILTRISVKSPKSPHACQNKSPLEWQASTVCMTSDSEQSWREAKDDMTLISLLLSLQLFFFFLHKGIFPASYKEKPGGQSAKGRDLRAEKHFFTPSEKTLFAGVRSCACFHSVGRAVVSLYRRCSPWYYFFSLSLLTHYPLGWMHFICLRVELHVHPHICSESKVTFKRAAGLWALLSHQKVTHYNTVI